MERFEVCEWTVENFCSYDEEIHELFIESPCFVHNKSTWFKLYPKGVLCKTGILSVRIKNFSQKELIGDLSLIAEDGTVLWLHLLNTKSENDVFEGPKYDDVIEHIRKTRKDRLMVRIRFQGPTDVLHVMRTRVDTSEVTFKVDPLLVSDLKDTYVSVASFKCLTENAMMEVRVEKDDKKDRIKFSLVRKNPREVLAKSCVSYLNDEGCVFKSSESRCLVFCQQPYVFLDLPKTELEGVTLVMTFKIIGGKIRTKHSRTSCLVEQVSQMPPDDVEDPSGGHATSNKGSATVLSEDLEFLYQDSEFSDLTLTCEEREFHVHRNILIARSVVFRNMFSSRSLSDNVHIEDMDSQTLSHFLTYLYTGAVEDLTGDGAVKLYYTADSYQVPSLKRVCADVLRRNITLSNVCDVLSLSDKYQDHLLKLAVHTFILKNLQSVMCSDVWKVFLEREPSLVARTLTGFGQKAYLKSGNANLNNEPFL